MWWALITYCSVYLQCLLYCVLLSEPQRVKPWSDIMPSCSLYSSFDLCWNSSDENKTWPRRVVGLVEICVLGVNKQRKQKKEQKNILILSWFIIQISCTCLRTCVYLTIEKWGREEEASFVGEMTFKLWDIKILRWTRQSHEQQVTVPIKRKWLHSPLLLFTVTEPWICVHRQTEREVRNYLSCCEGYCALQSFHRFVTTDKMW